MDREKVIKGLEYHLKELSIGKTCFECPYWGDNPCETQLIADAIVLLKKQEESIPVSWLEEKLVDHLELPYAITDGIVNVLELWEDNKQDD